MTAALPPSSGGGHGASCYEELRRQVLAGDSRGSGLAVLLSRGMKAWLDVVCSLEARPTPPLTVTGNGPLHTVPGEFHAQLTTVLAGMVLHGWQQGRHA